MLFLLISYNFSFNFFFISRELDRNWPPGVTWPISPSPLFTPCIDDIARLIHSFHPRVNTDASRFNWISNNKARGRGVAGSCFASTKACDAPLNRCQTLTRWLRCHSIQFHPIFEAGIPREEARSKATTKKRRTRKYGELVSFGKRVIYTGI